jgi:hypothetical protein
VEESGTYLEKFGRLGKGAEEDEFLKAMTK